MPAAQERGRLFPGLVGKSLTYENCTTLPTPQKENLVDVSDIFLFFCCSGRGKGESEGPGGGGGTVFLLKIPGGWGEAGRG